MDSHNTSKEPSSSLEAEEARLRDLVHEKKTRRSNPEEGNGCTETPVDSTRASSASRTITSSSLSEEAKNRSQGTSTTRKEGTQQGGQTPTNKTPSTAQSELRSSESGGVSKSSSGYSQSARGRKRKRERRRMNREARKRGEPLPEDDRSGNYRNDGGSGSGGRGPPTPHHRGPDGPGRWERGGYPPPRDWRGPPDRRGPPPRGEYDYSSYHSRSRSRSPRRHRDRRGRSRSRSTSLISSSGSESRLRSKSRRKSGERSRSQSLSEHNSRKKERVDGGSRERRRSGSRKRSGSRRGDESRGSRGSGSRKSKRRRSPSPSTSSSSSSSSSSEQEPVGSKEEDSVFSKDQRTVFVSQLVMRATEKDVRRYFKKKVGCLVKEVILLRDKRTGSHKGCAYVQLGRIEDVNKAVGVAGQPPDFQRFPILVKPSEAEKNYVINASSSSVTSSMMGTSTSSKPMVGSDGRIIESQKVYVGGLDPSVSEEHIFALFSQFGQLEKVTMQMDPATRTSRGYAFLSYRDPKEANLAIQTMGNQVLGGRPMKTGWASQTSTVQGVDVTTSAGVPDDAAERTKKALAVLAQMSGVTDSVVTNATISATAERALDAAMGGTPASKTAASSVPTVAEARVNLVAEHATATTPERTLAPTADPPSGGKMIGGNEEPTRNILVHNMYDKDTESGETWPTEIKEEFEEECSKFGKITFVKVMANEPGGKIYASFDTVEAATQCAKNLAGRWFDKRQLRVDYMLDSEMPKSDS